MEIKIKINGSITDNQQILTIKKNIEHEITAHKKELKGSPTELAVHLYDDPLSSSLTGSGFNKNGEELIKITYSLVPPHTRNYFFLGATITTKL